MGKAEIISEAGEGLYTVKVLHDTATADLMLARFNAVLGFLVGVLAKTTDPKEIATLKMRKAGVEKRIAAITEARDADFQTEAWCADYTHNLSGIVGTIEPGAEYQNGINIRPGYVDKSVFEKVRDGQATPFLTLPVADAMRNFAIMPAIQKWRPTFRYGVVSNVDQENSTCSVNLDGCWSGIQNLDINHQTHFDNVPIEYMNCNGEAFENGDHVLVRWEPYKTTGQVKVIGFKNNPKPCEGGPYVVINTQTGIPPYNDWNLRSVIIWDVTLGDYARHDDFDGLEWPLSWNQVKDFLAALDTIEIQSIWSPSVASAELPTDYVWGIDYLVCPDGEGEGYENQGISSYDLLNTHEWYVYAWLECQGFVDPCSLLMESGGSKRTETRMPAVHEEPNDSRPWGVYSYYLNPINKPEWGTQECRLQHEVDSDGTSILKYEEGDCFYDRISTTEYKYRFVTPIGDVALRKDYYHFEHDHLVNVEYQPYQVDDRYVIRDFKQFVTCFYSDKIFLQLYAIFCRRIETQRVSDGGWESEYTTIRDEYVNEFKCAAAVDYYRDEGGTATRHPKDQGRDAGLEAAVEKLLETVYDAGDPAEHLWVKFYQNEEEAIP
ncbi:hypothetical protein [uncultured Desulfosarcina sp.]|uniref:hypothetical protein n=1 Tax=uncultured Desulfosarcina sp. TaxID=218289 RepID=UPI0029C6066C|nr:hypothetical protein [uncultured Desulfosarcina sp.]